MEPVGIPLEMLLEVKPGLFLLLLLEMVRITSVQFHNSALLSPSVLAGTDYFSWQVKFHPSPQEGRGVKLKKAMSFLTSKVFGKEYGSKATP